MKMKKIFSKLSRTSIMGAVILSMLVSPVSTIDVSAADLEFNYAKALQYSQYFYDANMCGTGVNENNQYVWRKNCHTYDAKLKLDSTNTNMTESFITANKSVLDPDGDGCVDVSGGFHDAGDHVKFGMPEAYSGSTLGWGFYEFREQYETTEQDAHMKTILRYFNDYFMKCTFLDKTGKAIAFCYQVGDGDVDHAYWQSPEIDKMFRRGFFATDAMPSTDCLAAASASLTANYFNFKDEDPEYAAKNLKYAKALFEFAERAPEKAVNNDGPKGYYSSTKWEDDYCWAAAWLYLATQDDHYLDELFPLFDYYAPSCWTHCWNDVWAGTACLLGEIDDLYDKDSDKFENRYKTATNKSPYEEIDFWSQVAKTVDNWMQGRTPQVTPAGYSFLSQWGSARYNTATQQIALVYDKHHGDKASKYGEWAKSQMNYIMGDNPMNRCYIVGYNDISATKPHHRASSGFATCEETGDQRYVLYGALVGGPDAKDFHKDVTADYIYNEVTIDYNAAFVGACAGLYRYFGDSSMQITPDFPPPPGNTEDPEHPLTPEYWVEGFCKDMVQDGAEKATEITMYVKSKNVTEASEKLSVRYYFDSTGMSSIEPNYIELRELYDQAYVEGGEGVDGVLTGPTKYESSKLGANNIYYVEVTWDGYPIAGSNKKYQLALGTYAWQNTWNSKDDWSHQDLNTTDDNWTGVPMRTDYICVYDKGVLVGGIEPDGTKPSTPENPEQPDIIKGDLNGDKEVNAIDYAALKMHLLGSKLLTEDFLKAADMNDDTSIDAIDFALLKKQLLGI